MENNPLLEVLNTPKNRVYDVTDNYLRNVAIEDFKAHILDLLERQRKRSAEQVPLSYNLHETLKENITNAKLF
jgi:hypothetical protein